MGFAWGVFGNIRGLGPRICREDWEADCAQLCAGFRVIGARKRLFGADGCSADAVWVRGCETVEALKGNWS
jgi:hypothetical protein